MGQIAFRRNPSRLVVAEVTASPASSHDHSRRVHLDLKDQSVDAEASGSLA
jgi:hypothetical protein